MFPQVRVQAAKKNSRVTCDNPYGLLEAFLIYLALKKITESSRLYAYCFHNISQSTMLTLYIWYVLSSHYKGSISLNPAETKADTKPELI